MDSAKILKTDSFGSCCFLTFAPYFSLSSLISVILIDSQYMIIYHHDHILYKGDMAIFGQVGILCFHSTSNIKTFYW